MTTTMKPRQLNKDGLLRRLRELLDEGTDRDTILEKLRPCCGIDVSDQYLIDALDAVISALLVASEVSNPRMVQSHRDFHSFERRAQEEAGTYAKRCSHIETAYPDEGIRLAKRQVLDAGRHEWRIKADKAAEDWTELQKKRIPFDTAREKYPAALEDFSAWVAKPV